MSAWGFKMHLTKRRRKVISIVLAGGAVVALWCLLVHRCMGVLGCEACGYNAIYTDIRIAGYTVHRGVQVRRITLQARIAEDLGAPCEHPDLREYPVHQRYWGLCICFDRRPFAMEMNLDYQEVYTEQFRDQIRRLVRRQPGLAEEFRQRVLYEHEWQYFRAFRERIVAMVDSNGSGQ